MTSAHKTSAGMPMPNDMTMLTGVTTATKKNDMTWLLSACR